MVLGVKPDLVGVQRPYRITRPAATTPPPELLAFDSDRRTGHRPPRRRRPRVRARLIWPSMAELHACFQLSQRRQAAGDDAVFNELIARLDEGDDDCDG